MLREAVFFFTSFLSLAAAQDGVPRSPVVLIRQTGPSSVEAQPFPPPPNTGGQHFSFAGPFNGPLDPLFPSQGGWESQQQQPLPQQPFPQQPFPQAVPVAQPVHEQPLQYYQQPIQQQPVVPVAPIFGPAPVAAPPPPAFTGCINPIPVRPPDSSRCKWYPVYDALACVVDYECGEPDCPNSPVRPDSSTNCQWLEIKDRSGCIVDWECEPLNAAGCPGAPAKPDNPKCRWTPMKNNQGCVFNWFCTPILPGPPPPGYGLGAPIPPPRQGDKHPLCCFWASRGDCESNPIFMKTECRKACGTPQCQVDEAETCKTHLNLVGCKFPPRNPFGNFGGPNPFGPSLSPLPLPLNRPLAIPPLPRKPFGSIPLFPPKPALHNPFAPRPLSLGFGNAFNRNLFGNSFLGPSFRGPFPNLLNRQPLSNPFLPKPLPSFGPNFGRSFFNGPTNPLASFFGPKPLRPLGLGGPLSAITGPSLFDSPFGGPRLPPFPFRGPIGYCSNKSPGCQIWSLLGHCTSRTRFMLEKCPKSCGACGFLKKKKKKK